MHFAGQVRRNLTTPNAATVDGVASSPPRLPGRPRRARRRPRPRYTRRPRPDQHPRSPQHPLDLPSCPSEAGRARERARRLVADATAPPREFGPARRARALGHDARCGRGRGCACQRGAAETRCSRLWLARSPPVAGWSRARSRSRSRRRGGGRGVHSSEEDGDGSVLLVEESAREVHGVRIRAGYATRGGGTVDAVGPSGGECPTKHLPVPNSAD